MSKKQKPDKPYKEFPLFAHQNGQWAKKIRGKLYYFGVWDEPLEALDLFEKSASDLYAGREPQLTDSEFLTLSDLCNLFLASKLEAVEIGELNESTYKEYKRACERLLAALSRGLLVEEMIPSDFVQARNHVAREFDSPVSLKNEMTRWRVLFKWATDSGTIKIALPYGKALKPPPKRELRKAANKDRLYIPREIHALIDTADGFMVPCLWLAINCGLGNRDCIELRWEHIQDGWLQFPRPKTGVDRRAKLWQRTIKALDAWRKQAPSSEWVCAKSSGEKFQGENTPIAHLFRAIAQDAEIDQNGRGFYDLRHTYRTAADVALDQPAIMYTMGHADNSISGSYRHAIADDRLTKVANAVEDWLG